MYDIVQLPLVAFKLPLKSQIVSAPAAGANAGIDRAIVKASESKNLTVVYSYFGVREGEWLRSRLANHYDIYSNRSRVQFEVQQDDDKLRGFTPTGSAIHEVLLGILRNVLLRQALLHFKFDAA